MSQARTNNIAQRKPIFVTSVAGQSSMDLVAARIENMVIETVLSIVSRHRWGHIVKAYEWHQDFCTART